MFYYLLRRLMQLIPVFFGATLLIYSLVFLMPGDPIAALAGDKVVDPSFITRMRAEYNLDQPFFMQYLLYLKGIFSLDFGKTFSGVPVTTVIGNAFPVTIQLALMALTIEGIFGILVGFIAGVKRGGWFDSTFLVVSLVVIAIPTFVVGFVVQFTFGIHWRLFPTTVGTNVSFYSLLLPAVVLACTSFAYVLRITRQSIAENLTADFVRTAKAKGLSKQRVLSVHVLRNSLMPVITFLGADLGALMGGAIVTEGIFGINGIGGALYQAIIRGEPTTVVSITTVLIIVYIMANLLVDLLYALLDPRIRYA